MPAASMKQLLESGVHFGHQTRRWNPKMKPFIFTERGGIHIIDLQQTTVLLDRAYDFVRNVASRGGSVLFVGTKKQCQDIVREEASRVGMPYVSHRWLGGLLTNFATIENRIARMHELRKLKEEGQLGLLPTKERMAMERELEKLEINLGGVSNMTRLPDAVFVADPKREAIATKEVNKLGLPLIGLVDTNCDPDEVDYLIPGNDDAIRSCSLIVRTLARAVEEGRQKVQVAEFLAAEAAREAAASQVKSESGAERPAADLASQALPSRVSRAARTSGDDARRGGAGRGPGGGRSGGQGRPSSREGGQSRGSQERRPAAPRGAGGPRQEATSTPSGAAEVEAVEPSTAVTSVGELVTPAVSAPVSQPAAEPDVDTAAVSEPSQEQEAPGRSAAESAPEMTDEVAGAEELEAGEEVQS